MPLNLFLDDGGVMNDNTLRGRQYPGLVASYLAPRLGGHPDAWVASNHPAAQDVWQRSLDRTGLGYDAWARAFDIDWLRAMADRVGVPAPSDDDEALALARDTNTFVITRLRSAIPGAVDATRSLAGLGCPLYTASSGPSYDLDTYLRTMGVRDHFTTLYGPDLVGCFKYPFGNGDYYPAVLGHAGVDPRSAVFVDNALVNLAHAALAGARTVLVTDALDVTPTPEGFQPDIVIPRLADLPPLVDRLSAV